MTDANYRVRRATLDDLKELVALWEAMQFPVDQLERRLTDFQIAETHEGEFLGAVAIEISGRHGRVHYEAFRDFGLAEVLRPQLWDRLQSLAANHGLARLWTQEKAPFWSRCGLHPAAEADLKRLPQTWGSPEGEWLTRQLRDEEVLAATLDKEFTQFKEAARAQTEQALKRARLLKYIATFIAILLAGFVIAISLYILKNRSALHGLQP